ncbi:MAG: type II secretion system protein [Gemmatimonadaceae bacterium]|nr:type II secretion system protein [Gemmatimonadaceae bacterium]
MTLLELVIALAILGILVAVGGGAFSTVIDRERTIRTASVETERAAALRDMLRQWIAQGDVQIQQGGGPGGAQSAAQRGRTATVAQASSRAGSAVAGVTAAASTGNELTVVTSAPNPLMAPQARIRIFVDADDNTPERGLTIEYQATTQTPLMRRQLDPDVADITVEFYDQRLGRWLPSTEAATGGQLVALRLTMVPAEGKTLSPLLTEPITYVFGEISQATR